MFLTTARIKSIVLGGLFVLLLLVIGLVGKQIIDREVAVENQSYLETEQLNAGRFAAQLRAEIEQDLNQRLFTVVGMKGFVVENDYEVDEEKFQSFARALVEDTPAIRSLQLAPDAVVTHVYPLEGNEAALGHNLLVDDVRRESVLMAIDTNQYIITGPIQLLQGGNALIARLPIYKAHSTTTLSGVDEYTLDRFWGFATVLVDVDVVYEVIAKNTSDGLYQVALRGADGAGAEGAVFYGEPVVFEQNPVVADIQLPVGSWQIGVLPEEGWVAVSPASFYIAITGYLLLSVLLGLVLFTVIYIRTKFFLSATDEPTEKGVMYFLRQNLLGGFLVLMCAGLTAIGLYFSQAILTEMAEVQFSTEVEKATLDVVDRMQVYTQVLEGGEGFLAASEDVDRIGWKTYVDSLALSENYPGIQGVAYAVFVTPEEKEAHELSIQEQGFPEYTIRPPGDRELYTSIIYVEPFDERNRQVLGFDMFQEENRNAAMSKARDTGEVAASRKVILVQEIDNDVQAGFLLYVPHYGGQTKPNTTQQRQDSILGYVYSPFRARDLIEGVIGEDGLPNIGLQIYDNSVVDEASLLYSDLDKKFVADVEPRFTQQTQIEVGGNTWLLVFSSTEDFGVTATAEVVPYAIFALGLLITLMLGLVFYVLSSSRGRAVVLAGQMTSSFQIQRKRLESFHAIVTMPDVSLEQRIQNTLKIVTTELGLDIGIVSQIDGSKYVVRNVYTANNAPIAIGDEFMLGNTYCDITYANEDLVAIDDMGTSKFASHPAYKAMHLEAYIGAPLRVNGQDYGTVNFSSAAPHPAFTEDDKTFMGLAVRWIARMLENQQVDRTKDEFVSLASHQLRTPLSIVNWYAEILQDESLGLLTSDQKEYLAEIAEGNRRMTELVNSLLNVSRLDLGTFKIEPTEIKLKKMLLTIKKQYATELKAKKIKWKQTLDEKVSTVVADQTILNLVFDNLVSNAIKYTPEKGSVTVEISALPKKQFAFTVSDTGFGIPKDQQNKMFSKMFRADNVSTKDTVGSGLGLYMVKSIVEAVGGTISFESKENKGTTFVLHLPQKMEVRKGTSRLSNK